MEPNPVQTQPPVPESVSTPPQIEKPKSNLPSLLSLLILGALLAGGGYYLGMQKTAVAPVPSTSPIAVTPDPTVNWQTYSDNKFSLKYPEGVTITSQQQGPSTTTFFHFIGPTQAASGRTETSISDGYKISVLVSPHASVAEPDELINAANKGRQTDMNGAPGTGQPCQGSSVSSTILDSAPAAEYRVTDCLGNVHVIIALHGSASFQLVALYSDPKYQVITDQILSTLKFTN